MSHLSSHEALRRLLEGNRRFATGSSAHSHLREASRGGRASRQTPFAVIFGCADSRVPVELVFDQGFGDLFVIRNAGNIVGESVLASMEFAVTQLGCPLIVVLGHSNCGAVTAAVEFRRNGTPLPGRIPSIVRAIEPVVQGVGVADIDEVMRVHVIDTLRRIGEASDVISGAVAAGALGCVAAEYDLETGAVNVLKGLS